MPVYEVELGGKTYEVEAASPEELAKKLPGIRGAVGPAAPVAPEREPYIPSGFGGGAMAPSPSIPAEGMVEAGRALGAGAARVPVGAGQAVSAVRDIVQPGSLERYNAAATDFLDMIRGKAYKEVSGGEKVLERTAEFLAGMPLGAQARVQALWPAIKAGAQTAGLGGLITFDEDAETLAQKTGSAVLSATAGTVLTGGLAAPGWLKQKAPQWFMKMVGKDGDEVQTQAADALMRDFPQLADWLTFGQRSGSYGMSRTEAGLAANYALKAYREQAKVLEQGLRQYGTKYGPGFDPERIMTEAVARGQKAIRTEVQSLAKVRKLEWDAALNNAEAAVTAAKIASKGVKGAEQSTLAMSGFEDGLQELAERFNLPLKDLSPALQRLRKEIDTFGGTVSIETLVDTLRKSNTDSWAVASSASVARPNEARAFARDFRRLLFDTIDQMEEGSSDAVRWVKLAREQYAKRSDQLKELRTSGTARLLGLDKGMAPSPQAVLEKTRELPLAEKVRMRTILERRDPQLLAATRQLVWQDAMRKATSQRGSAAEAAFDPVAFADDMIEQVGKDSGALSGMFTKAQAEEIRNLLGNVRAIGFRQQGFARVATPEEVGMVASNPLNPRTSAPFWGRLFYRMVMMRDAEKALFTAEGRDALMQAALADNKPALEAALGRATAIANGALFGDGEEEEQ